MKKSRYYISSLIITIIIFLVILLTSIQIITFNRQYYNWHYSNYNISLTTNIEQKDLMYITNEMLKYLDGKRENLIIYSKVNGINQQVFGDREIYHMKDVQKLFVIAKYIRNIGFGLIIILFMTFYKLHKSILKKTLKYIKNCYLSIILLLIVISVIISTNFNHYFTVFHQIFFNNDLWLLDPKTDILINLVPLQFFINTAILILFIFIIFSILLIVAIKYITKRI